VSGRPSVFSFVSIMRLSFSLAALACLLSLSLAQSIGAFYTSLGPTVIKLNEKSGNFSYNVYKATGFSDEWPSFAPTFAPVNGTAMAVTGFSSPSAVYVCFSFISCRNQLTVYRDLSSIRPRTIVSVNKFSSADMHRVTAPIMVVSSSPQMLRFP